MSSNTILTPAPDAKLDSDRIAAIQAWLATITTPSLQLATMRPASADASFRRYFRIDGNDGQTYIVMDAPQPAEDVRPFIQVAELFAQINLTVP